VIKREPSAARNRAAAAMSRSGDVARERLSRDARFASMRAITQVPALVQRLADSGVAVETAL
jgi:hypothetical protein